MDKESLTEIVRNVISELRDPEYHLPIVTRDLEECGIDYAIIGGLALRLHNVLRETDKIELLISKATSPRIAEYIIGCGYGRRPGSDRDLSAHDVSALMPSHL